MFVRLDIALFFLHYFLFTGWHSIKLGLWLQSDTFPVQFLSQSARGSTWGLSAARWTVASTWTRFSLIALATSTSIVDIVDTATKAKTAMFWFGEIARDKPLYRWGGDLGTVLQFFSRFKLIEWHNENNQRGDENKYQASQMAYYQVV